MAEETGGLLDFLSSPAGMGLLSAAAGGMAGARRGAPWNTAGAALMGGVQGYMTAADPAKQFQKLINNELIGAVKGQPAQVNASSQTQPASWYGDNTPIAPQTQPQSQSNGIGFSPRIMQMLALQNPKGAAELRAQKQDSLTGYEQKIGWNIMPDGSRRYIADPTKGFGINDQGVVSVMPGFIPTNDAIKGGEARATESAKAVFDLLKPAEAPYDRQTGRPMVGTRSDAINSLRGGQPIAPVANMGANTVAPYQNKQINDIAARVSQPHAYDQYFIEYGKKYGVDPVELKMRSLAESGLNPNAVSSAGAAGVTQLMPATARGLGVTNRNDPRQSIEGAARLISQYQKDAGGHNTMVDMLYYGGADTNQWGANTQQYAANLNAARQKLGLKSANIEQQFPQQTAQPQQSPQQATQGNQGGLYYPTQAELAGAKAGAEADVEVDKQGRLKTQEVARSSEQRYGQMASAIPEARQLLQKATGSGIGSLYDKAAGFVGSTPQGAKEATQLRTLSGWMTSNVPRMEGPQSDRDTQLYRDMAAMVGDDKVPRDQRLAALDTLEKLQDKYRHLNVPAANRNAASNPAPAQQPQAGMVKSGFRFKGGNPADRNSWEKV